MLSVIGCSNDDDARVQELEQTQAVPQTAVATASPTSTPTPITATPVAIATSTPTVSARHLVS